MRYAAASRVPEIVRLGFSPWHMADLGALIARALQGEPEAVAPEVTALRRRVANGALRFVRA